MALGKMIKKILDRAAPRETAPSRPVEEMSGKMRFGGGTQPGSAQAAPTRGRKLKRHDY